MNSARSDVIWKQIRRLYAHTHMLDEGQFPYNPWLKASIITSALYDDETIYLLLGAYMMNIVSQQQKKIN